MEPPALEDNLQRSSSKHRSSKKIAKIDENDQDVMLLRKRLSKSERKAAARLHKRSSKRTFVSGTDIEQVNPFQVDEFISPIEWAKLAFGVLILIPVRGLLIALTIAVTTALMALSTIGVDTSKPLPADRMKIQKILTEGSNKIFCFCFGIYDLKIKGKRASSDECKMLVVASHSTVMDAIVTGACFGGASAVGKAELRDTILGPLFTGGQMIFVDREDKDNKKNVARQIKERVDLNGPWSRQLAIAVEGTCTNRTSLIQFKRGAFDPGMPVQPVALHWKYKNFDPSWTTGSRNRMLIVLRSLSQWRQDVTVEFLPVHVPSEEEKADPILFASNVRDSMAKVLKIPTSEYSYPDMFLAKVAAKKKLKVGLALPFAFVALQEELKDTSVDKRLFELTKTLLGRFAKAANDDARLDEKRFAKVSAKAASDVGLTSPLEWEDFEQAADETIGFHTFLTAHIRAAF